jgi:hypothetical protein
MGLIPLLWLVVLHFKGKACDRAWWFLAGAFTVSWVADSVSHWTGVPFVGILYPMAQTILVAFVFWDRDRALWLIVAIGFVGIADIAWHGVNGPDILLRTVAWLSIVGIVYPIWQLGRLRTSLLVTFGLGWLLWMCYAGWPGWWSWGFYQASRLLGIGLFCIAANHPEPHLRLLRST